MTPQQTISAEWSLLATMAQANVWPKGVSVDLFAHPPARRLFGWMMKARKEEGLWSPIAVGCVLERVGYDADVVDAAVDALVETAPIYEPKHVPALLGFLIEQKGCRDGLSQAEVAVSKHQAGCRLSESEIEALSGGGDVAAD